MPDVVERVLDVDEEHHGRDDERDEADGAETELVGAREAFGEEIRDCVAGDGDDELVDPLDEFGDGRFLVECDDEACAHDEQRDEREHGGIGAARDAREEAHVAHFGDEEVDEAENGVKAPRRLGFVIKAVDVVLTALFGDFCNQV